MAEQRRRTIQRDVPGIGETRLHFHDDGVVIEPAAPYPHGLASLTLRDDRSTAYSVSGCTKFVAAGPPDAAWLELSGPDGPVRFYLDG